jgi:hypothetical protein
MNIEFAFLVIQALFAVVMLFFGMTLKNLREDIKDNGESVASLARMLAERDVEAMERFVSKGEAEARWERLHDVGNRVTALETMARMRVGQD